MESIIQYSYLMGWALGILSVVDRALLWMGFRQLDLLPFTSRGLFFASGFMFVLCIASVAYSQAFPDKKETSRKASA